MASELRDTYSEMLQVLLLSLPLYQIGAETVTGRIVLLLKVFQSLFLDQLKSACRRGNVDSGTRTL